MPSKIKKQHSSREVDSVYFLKLVVLLVLGSLWVRIVSEGGIQIPIPVGLIVGIFLLRKERLQLDRKIGYAILLMATFISFWLPLGVTIAL